jgi:hypothetical protein
VKEPFKFTQKSIFLIKENKLIEERIGHKEVETAKKGLINTLIKQI